MISSMCSTLRVLVVDDHELTRFSLRLALKNQKNIELVGMASNGQEAVEIAKRNHPDVVILDLQMPVMDGLSASMQIKSFSPNTRIIAYTSVEDPQIEVMVQTAKVDAFCKKDVSTEDLLALVRELGQQVTNQ